MCNQALGYLIMCKTHDARSPPSDPSRNQNRTTTTDESTPPPSVKGSIHHQSIRQNDVGLPSGPAHSGLHGPQSDPNNASVPQGPKTADVLGSWIRSLP